jgi:hypothetical protein
VGEGVSVRVRAGRTKRRVELLNAVVLRCQHLRFNQRLTAISSWLSPKYK